MQSKTHCGIAATLVLLLASSVSYADSEPWSAQQAQGWYGKQRWLVGSNYIPADAINQLEMWQAETFDPAEVDLIKKYADEATN